MVLGGKLTRGISNLQIEGRAIVDLMQKCQIVRHSPFTIVKDDNLLVGIPESSMIKPSY